MTNEPPRGEKRYRIYCPHCERQGVFAGWRRLLTGEEVPPEEFTCPECGEKVDVLGREDQ